MGFGGLIRDVALPLIKGLVGGQDGFMDDVTIQYWQRDLDSSGKPDLSSPVPFQALVVRLQKAVKKSDGQDAMSSTYLAFLEELPAVTGPGVSTDRRQPLDERDVITLSDGTTGPILSIEGLMDQATSAPFLLEVYLG